MSRRLWTPKELAELQRLSDQSFGLTEMAEVLGRPVTSIVTKCAALGIPYRDGRQTPRRVQSRKPLRWTPERVNEMQTLAATKAP